MSALVEYDPTNPSHQRPLPYPGKGTRVKYRAAEWELTGRVWERPAIEWLRDSEPCVWWELRGIDGTAKDITTSVYSLIDGAVAYPEDCT